MFETWEEWERYYIEYAELPCFKKRVAKAKETIQEFFNKKLPSYYCSISGGKDSCVLMHLVREFAPEIKFFSQKDNFDFPEAVPHLLRLKEKYNLNLDLIELEIPESYLEKLSLCEDLHSQGTALSNDFFYDEIAKWRKENNMNAVFIGLRSQESRGRRMNRIIKGKIYYKKSWEQWVCQPIADFEGSDVFAYLITNKIPVMEVYKKIRFSDGPEWIREGWFLPSKQASRGNVAWLKYHYPELFQRLVKIDPKVASYA